MWSEMKKREEEGEREREEEGDDEVCLLTIFPTTAISLIADFSPLPTSSLPLSPTLPFSLLSFLAAPTLHLERDQEEEP